MQLVPSTASGALPSLSDVRAMLARRSLRYFVREAWHVVEPSTRLEWNWHLDAICDHVQALLEGRIPKNELVINVPPGSMKSLIVSVFAPAWWWIDHPEWRVIFASANPRVMTRDSIRCRDVIESDWYRATFKPSWRLADDQNAKQLYKTTRGGFRMSVSANAKVTGDRAHALFWDDLLDARDTRVQSKAARETVNYWYDQAFANRLADARTGIKCGICQRLHEDDPAGHIQAQGTAEFLIIPMLYEPPKDGVKPRTSIGWSDPRTKPNEMLFPARFPATWIAAERIRLTETGFASQHQQKPSPESGIIFQAEWLARRFTWPANHERMTVEQLCAAMGITRIVSGWDTALGEKQTNDYTANTVIGEAPGKLFVLAHRMERMTAPVTKQAVKDNFARWKPVAVPIEGEGSASGKAIIQMLRDDTLVPCIEVPNIDKVTRAQKVAPTVQHQVWFPEGEPWVDKLVHSLKAFPRAAHDDDVDSFTITVEHLVFGQSTTGLLDWYEQQAREAAERARRAAGGR